MQSNPARQESTAIHITHASTYATLALGAQALVTLALPYAGVSLPPVVLAAVISILVGGGTVVLHMMGIALPGGPSEATAQDQLRQAVHTLLVEEGPTLLAHLTQAAAPAPVAPHPLTFVPVPGSDVLVPAPGPAPLQQAPMSQAPAPAAPAPAPAGDGSWGGPAGPQRPLGAGHGPLPSGSVPPPPVSAPPPPSASPQG